MKKTCYTPKKGVDRVQTLCYDEDPKQGTNPAMKEGKHSERKHSERKGGEAGHGGD
jgi:hypothetical protein